MLRKLYGHFITYSLISFLALLIPIIITPHMELYEGQVEFSISKILIIASFVSLLGSFSLMNFLPVIFVKQGRNNLNRITSKILIFYIISSLLILIILGLFFSIKVSLQITLIALSTMIYSTIVIYNQCFENDRVIIFVSIVYYTIILAVYFVLVQYCSIAWSRILANVVAVLLILIYHLNEFDFSSFFNNDQWKEIIDYSKSILLHLIFGIALTYVDKFFLLKFISEEYNTRYSFIVLYFMPFASFYNQLFNSWKPQIYSSIKEGNTSTKFFILNVCLSGVGVIIYGFVLFLYLRYLKVGVNLELFIPVGLITWIWCHYLLPASTLIFKNRNKMLSRTSIITTIIAVISMYLLVLSEVSPIQLLYFYSLIILSYNMVLKFASNAV